MSNLVHEITNATDRIQVRVWLIDGRYRVSLLDLDAVRADRLPFAVDYNLRRVDRSEAQEVGVALLAPRCRGTGERVLPA